MAAWCAVSGGADGADTEWLRACQRFAKRVQTTIWSFDGHRITYMPPNVTIQLLGDDSTEADEALLAASKCLGKFMPKRNTLNLLRRNYYTVKGANCVVAIGKFVPKKTVMSIGIDGGTGWACQLYANMFEHDVVLPLFVFAAGKWHQCTFTPLQKFGWQECATPPTFKGRCALIGSREITEADKRAIEQAVQFNAHK